MKSRTRKQKQNDSGLDSLQSNLWDGIERIRRTQIIDGVLLEGLVVGTTSVVFDHKLSRKPLGWFIVDIDKAAAVFRTDWDKFTITLESSVSDTTVNIWVF